MTDARKIKIFLRRVYFQKKWPRNEELLKATYIMSVRGKGWIPPFVYLFSYLPVPYRRSVHLGNTTIPGKKTSSYLAKKTIPFFLAVLANVCEFRVYEPSEKGAQCGALSMYQRFAPSSAASKPDVSLHRNLPLLNVTKSAFDVSLVSQIQDLFPCFPMIERKSYSSQQLRYRVNFSTSCTGRFTQTMIFLTQFLAYFVSPASFSHIYY